MIRQQRRRLLHGSPSRRRMSHRFPSRSLLDPAPQRGNQARQLPSLRNKHSNQSCSRDTTVPTSIPRLRTGMLTRMRLPLVIMATANGINSLPCSASHLQFRKLHLKTCRRRQSRLLLRLLPLRLLPAPTTTISSISSMPLLLRNRLARSPARSHLLHLPSSRHNGLARPRVLCHRQSSLNSRRTRFSIFSKSPPATSTTLRLNHPSHRSTLARRMPCVTVRYRETGAQNSRDRDWEAWQVAAEVELPRLRSRRTFC